jgi:hypothetical protein
MINLDNLKPSWGNYKRLESYHARINEEDILGMIEQHEKRFSTPFPSRMLMNFCMSAFIMLCCTGC